MRFSMMVLFCILTLSACTNFQPDKIPTDGIYLPPTQIPPNTLPDGDQQNESESFSDNARPAPTPECMNNLLFLSDLTIPDGTVIKPGEYLDKRWQVQNNGTCNWNSSFHVKLIAGPAMGVPVQQALYPALSGTEIIIRMIFIGPSEPGNYRSAWQAYDPQDNPFGDPFFIDVIVEAAEVEATQTPEDG